MDKLVDEPAGFGEPRALEQKAPPDQIFEAFRVASPVSEGPGQ
jgi:hypothetical protein